ncbi:MAG: SpoIIIAH-like family protein [Clostridia bacterium]|nr:SpoIIIAH-like family protein [Clostridia bacterium]
MKKISFKEYFENLKKISEVNSERQKNNKEKFKQITLFVIAVLLFVIGYTNYKPNNYEENGKIAISENENADMIGDVELVNSKSIVENDTVIGSIVDNNNLSDNSTIEDNSNLKNVDYFESARIERDSMYSRMLETYHKMIDNTNLGEPQKSIAVQEIEKITNNQNAIMISENLIKNKGFEDAVVFANVDVINVIVKSSILSNEDIGKIQNIIEREFKVPLENVNISNKN